MPHWLHPSPPAVLLHPTSCPHKISPTSSTQLCFSKLLCQSCFGFKKKQPKLFIYKIKSSLSRFWWQVETRARKRHSILWTTGQVLCSFWSASCWLRLNPSNNASPAIATLSEVINTASDEIISSILKRTRVHNSHLDSMAVTVISSRI